MSQDSGDDSTPSNAGDIPRSEGKRRRKGTAKACSHCRRRKIRCTGETPRCKNCEIHDQDCVYTQSTRKPRPTNAVLNQLRRENQQLRDRRKRHRGQSSLSASHASVSPIRSPVGEHSPEPTASRTHVTPSAPVYGEPAHSDRNATYHGPTSTLYNSSVAEQNQQHGMSPEREALMSKSLFAAAAHGRHMEVIDTRQNRLDFDGVDPELGLHLLYLHWNRQHHAFLVTYRPAFMRDMACGGPFFSKLLLNAIMYGASKFSPRLELRKDPTDVRTAGWRFRDRIRDLLGQALDHSSITTIQALLQMSNSLFALGQSAAWTYAGIAFRMMVDLGLHIDVDKLPDSQRFSEEEMEIRRRVYWAGFVVDKMQSLYQGRPAGLQTSDVPIRFLDEYEELEHWQPYAYTRSTDYAGHPSYSVSTFRQLCQLCIILADILDVIYQGNRSRSAKISNSLLQQLTRLDKRLRQWDAELPPHLQLDLSGNTFAHAPPPHVLSLLAMGAVLRILLHRPFVADGHLHNTSPDIAHTSLAACAEAATTIVKVIRVYDEAFGVRRAPYLMCYATYVAATVHVRIAASRGNSSEAHDSLRTCLSVFDQNAETNYAANKASRVIRRLMNTMAITVREPSTSRIEEWNGGLPAASSPAAPSQAVDVAQDQGLAAPTFVSGEFAPGIDVDAVIQSFWNVEQTSRRDDTGSMIGTLAQSDLDMSSTNASTQWSTGNESSGAGLPAFGNVQDNIFGFDTLDIFPAWRPNASHR